MNSVTQQTVKHHGTVRHKLGDDSSSQLERIEIPLTFQLLNEQGPRTLFPSQAGDSTSRQRHEALSFPYSLGNRADDGIMTACLYLIVTGTSLTSVMWGSGWTRLTAVRSCGWSPKEGRTGNAQTRG